jgi:hypothetical protein
LLEETIVPFRVPRHRIPMGTEFRSTWLTASLEIFRERGYFDRYLANLEPDYHEPILRSIAGVWLPDSICVAHYRAADALGLSVQEQLANGKAALQRLQKTIFSFGFHAAREVGVTPWTMLKALPKTWDREWRGGGIGIFKIGPKDARIEIIGFRGCAIAYCRNGMRGVAMGLCELVCSKAYAREIPALCTDSTVGFHVSWA